MVKVSELGLQVGEVSVSVRSNGTSTGAAASVGLSTTSAASVICSSTECLSGL